MFLTDPALRLIAARTGDVWAEHVWRHHTDAQDSTGELARLLHKIALEFNDTTTLVDRQLDRLRLYANSYSVELFSYAEVFTAETWKLAPEVTAQLARHQILAKLLTDAYNGWRTHYAPSPNATERHLLLRHGELTDGVVTLRRVTEDRWHVVPDQMAAGFYDLPYADRVVGEVSLHDAGYRPEAYVDRGPLAARTYLLPPQDDLAAACRALLGWWRLCHSAAWRDRTPDQLTADELDDLAE